MANEIDTLSRFELSVGEELSEYLAHKQEVEEIIRFLTLLNNTDSEGDQPFSFTVPRHMAKKTSIKLNTLFEAKSYAQLLDALKGTRYEGVFKKYKIGDSGYIPIAEIENELYIELYRELYAIPDMMNSSEKDELRDILDAIADYENFTRIIRFKKYYDSDHRTILRFLLPFGSLSRKTLDAMINAKELGEVYKLMESTKQGKLMSKISYSHTGELPLRVKFRKARHSMYYSDSPAAVMLSYILLCEVELHNLIIIIEAARYNVDRQKIEPILIY